MSPKIRQLAITLLVFLSAIVPASATPQTVEWEDLLPKLPPLVDPLSGLPAEQAISIDTITWARTLSEDEKNIDYNQDGIEDAAKYEKEMAQQGIDVDKLVKDYNAWQLEVDRREKVVRQELDGKQIRISGYLLPLSFSEEGDTEFLLVPYVGACIHTPAPPSNQTVFVETAQPFKVSSLFTPVWITGTVKTKSSTKKLTLVDGTADISIGYYLAGTNVEEYKKK